MGAGGGIGRGEGGRKRPEYSFPPIVNKDQTQTPCGTDTNSHNRKWAT